MRVKIGSRKEPDRRLIHLVCFIQSFCSKFRDFRMIKNKREICNSADPQYFFLVRPQTRCAVPFCSITSDFERVLPMAALFYS